MSDFLLSADRMGVWGRRNRDFIITFFCGQWPRSRSYGRTAALRLTVQPLLEDATNV
jgi:hypothetical protein